jgi:hypothetical protein
LATASLGAASGSSTAILASDNASLVLSANNSDKMYIAANGNVGVAIATPLSTFHVEGQIRTSTSSNYATFNNNFLRSYAAGNYYFDNNTTGVDTVFRTSNASALDTTAMNVKANGVIDLPVGQIKFPASQNASSDANTLDDYEEGTWTPVATSGGGSITTYSSNGVYTKIGNIVTCSVGIVITNAGTAASNIIVTFPFNAATAGSYSGVGSEYAQTGVTCSVYVNSASNFCVAKYDATTIIATGRQIGISITYKAA